MNLDHFEHFEADCEGNTYEALTLIELTHKLAKVGLSNADDPIRYYGVLPDGQRTIIASMVAEDPYSASN